MKLCYVLAAPGDGAEPGKIRGAAAASAASTLLFIIRNLQCALMKLVRWKRFAWDLSKLPPPGISLPAHYHVRPMEKEDERDARDVIFSAFSLDTDWSDAFKIFKDALEEQIAAAFAKDQLSCIVVTHGQRVMAASALDCAPGAETHLLSGPCVRMEYRNRGIGSALLHASLAALKSGGVSFALGLCKASAPTAKFVYTKYGSTSEAYDYIPSTAGLKP